MLIYGASGTSGTIALQFAKYLRADVTGVCGPANIRFIEELGTDRTLDYTNDNEIDKLEKYDLVLDCVGKARSSALKKVCKRALTKNGQQPINDRCYSLEHIVEAHTYVEHGHKRGMGP